MPELPEVEAFRAYIADNALHKTIDAITSSAPTLVKQVSFPTFKKDLVGASFSGATRKGKYVILSVAHTDQKVIIHFGLTGSIAYTKDQQEDIQFSKVIFYFKHDGALHWIDKRKFGALWLVDNIATFKPIQQLGPDPLTLTFTQFNTIAQARKHKNIKTFLMDQKIIAGIGNEYADEILFQAGIDPRHTISDLSDSSIKKIYTDMHKILTYFTKKRLRDVKKLHGNLFFVGQDVKDMDPSYLTAHRHGDKRCPKNERHLLAKISIGGRSTYYCPKDQQ